MTKQHLFSSRTCHRTNYYYNCYYLKYMFSSLISPGRDVIYSCYDKAEFLAAITPVFSVARSFGNHCNTLVCCIHKHSYYQVFFSIFNNFYIIQPFLTFGGYPLIYEGPYYQFWKQFCCIFFCVNVKHFKITCLKKMSKYQFLWKNVLTPK